MEPRVPPKWGELGAPDKTYFMPRRHEKFINGEFYHIITRGIDGNLLFKDINDYYRGIFSIYEFNNVNPVEILKRRKEIQRFKNRMKKLSGAPSSTHLGGTRVSARFSVNSQILIESLKMPDNRELLVEIIAFCFMPNHIHLLIRQLKTNGITKFMQKLGGGYGNYFNKKYHRKGYVFQNTFVSVHIENDRQLKAALNYIHINSISLIEPKWKEIGIKNPEKVIEFLENEFRWSSCFDYIGKKNFPSITEREFMLKVMGGEQDCKDAIEDWVRYKGEISEFQNFVLE